MWSDGLELSTLKIILWTIILDSYHLIYLYMLLFISQFWIIMHCTWWKTEDLKAPKYMEFLRKQAIVLENSMKCLLAKVNAWVSHVIFFMITLGESNKNMPLWFEPSPYSLQLPDILKALSDTVWQKLILLSIKQKKANSLPFWYWLHI